MTPNTHVTRHPRVWSKKQNKNYLEKIVLAMWSQICGKMAKIVHKFTLKKSLYDSEFHGVIFGRYARCDANYTCFLKFFSSE